MPYPRLARRMVNLSTEQRVELESVRDHHASAYLRERAAALLKVAAGASVYAVAKKGLLRPRQAETVSRWIGRYEREGVTGLQVRAGRGRKPAFSPSGGKPSGRD